MSEQAENQQDVLAKLIERHSEQDGVHETKIPSLFFIRHSYITGPTYGVYKPSFCIVVQGAKEVLLGQERFKYSSANYLVASMDLPVTAQVTEASIGLPYLSLKLEFTTAQILEVLSDSKVHIGPHNHSNLGMFVSQMEPSLLDAVLRLVRLLDHPEDIPFLRSIITKEILYRILQGEHGITLEHIAMEGSAGYQIRNVIEHIVNHLERSFRIEELAEMASMSVASLHRHFKEVTAMSPIQFQKQLRLQKARRLLFSGSTDAADVAFRVGYESPSQFSREYSRLFGLPPRKDVKHLRERNDQTIEA
ncbi:AraC family transcriptional regulator [Ferroacidibacillus organovorans]|uniref:AraC family transcriptional regulator n=1 Tax=Ferroacidibacillus organovorans TaxID=1765683 RepID=A0A162TZU0_9BACL|nr:AraC family transcriptional regulator [Ferroacidibacillus organovorans]KYP81284.1 AraC family transcriptional regulator [Ferroacidibacillus organovorans]OAG95319.1 AraC family transcriptional regulator [Ferroacidibacillus organovorans]OPG17137.1 AraC family transcriptional regulator [Ferroacidibacillus organovorans]